MKAQRHAAILRLVRDHTIPSQSRLQELLRRAGHEVTQATLSRDIHELGLVKLPDPEGATHYASAPDELVPPPTLAAFLPSLLLHVDGVGPLLVLRTSAGSASTLAAALDREAWPEILGTLAGDDTLLVVARSARERHRLTRRLTGLVAPRH